MAMWAGGLLKTVMTCKWDARMGLRGGGRGCVILDGALTYAELAAMMPRAGGEYVFGRED